MKLSARNQLKGKIIKITRGAVNAVVVIELTKGLEITANISTAAVDELKLYEGKEAYAVIKATSVMVGLD